MSEPKDGGPAFPSLERFETYSDATQQYVEHYAPVGGMSLRDYFAAHILPAEITAMKGVGQVMTPTELAEAAYQFADALLAERVKAEGRQP